MESGPKRVVNRVLVACGGGDAEGIVTSVQRAGLEAVAVFTTQNAEAGWLDDADYATQLEPGTDPVAVLSAALDAGADAVLPGSGPWARSAQLSQLAANVGLLWIGAATSVLSRVGDASAVRAIARDCGLAVLPHSPAIQEPAELRRWVDHLGPPLVVRGIGIGGAPPRVIVAGVEARELLERPPAGPLLVERIVPGARRIVVVVVSDGEGGAVAVGEHEDAVLVEGQVWLRECPSELPTAGLRPTLHNAAAKLVVELGVRGVSGVVFQVGGDGHIWLDDLWPGLPPAYGLHNIVAGIDLVAAQLALALGDELGWSQADIAPIRAAIELTVFVTASGTLEHVDLPEGYNWQLLVHEGAEVEAAADPALLRLVVDGPTRHAALVMAGVALAGVQIDGVPTTLGRLRTVLGGRDLWEGRSGLVMEVPAVPGALPLSSSAPQADD